MPTSGPISISRRSAVALLATTFAARAIEARAQAGGRTLAYIGTYTDKGKGIHLFEVDRRTGHLAPIKQFADLPNPSSIAIAPSKRFLYAAVETPNYQGTGSGAVGAFAIDPANGDLRLLNVVSSEGGGPAHMGLAPDGRHLFAANYGAGSAAVVPIRADGSLAAASDTFKISGPLGPQKAVDAPPGSFAISGHDAPHAHMATTDPAGRFLLVTDLGTDRIYIFRFDAAAGKITPNDPPFLQARPGAGPRHLSFHPGGTFVYSVNEEASTVDAMTYDAANGRLAIVQSLSTLPSGYEGTNFPSAIYVLKNGKFLVLANRLHDTLAIYAIGSDGRLTLARHEWTRGSYPRDFGIDPSGRFLYVLHTRSDNVTIFDVDQDGGNLSFTGRYVGVGNPSKIEFLSL